MTDSRNTERRTATRNSTDTPPRPTLKVGRQEFDVVDVSRHGLRIAGGNQLPLSGWVKGVLHLVGRNPIPVDAIVIRRQDGEVGLRLIAPIPV
jgi:PilZ domain